MILLQPWWLLAGLLGCAGVLVLHMRRRRSRTVSSLVLWRRVAVPEAVERTRWHRPRASLPLVLQLAAVALMAFALAQPRASASGPRPTLVLLDVSASMGARIEGTTPYERALEHVRGEARGAGPWSVLAVGTQARPVALSFDDGTDLLRRLEAEVPAPHAGRADWRGAARIAAQMTRDVENLDVLVLSDDPQEARAALEAYALEARFGAVPQARANAGIVSLRLEHRPSDDEAIVLTGAPDVPEADAWRVIPELHAEGTLPERGRVEVQIRPDGTDTFLPWTEREIDLTNGDASLEASLTGGGWLRVRLTDLEGAPLPGWREDDAVVARIDPAPAPRDVLVVGEPGTVVRRALEAVPGVRVERASALPDDVAGVDAVVAFEPLPREPDAPVWYAGVPYDERTLRRVRERVSGWDPHDPLARGIAWSELDAFPTDEMPPRAGARTVVHGGRGPLVQAWVGASGVRVATGFDPAVLDASASAALPQFVTNVLDWLAEEPTTSGGCRVDVACVVPPGATVVDPSGQVLRAPVATDALPDRVPLYPRRSGLHTLRVDGASRPLPVLPPSVPDVVPAPVDVPDAPPPSGTEGRLASLVWALALLALLVDAALGLLRHVRARRGGRAESARRGATIVLLTVVAGLGLVAALVALPWPSRLQERVVVLVGAAAPGSPGAERDPPGVAKVRRIPLDWGGTRAYHDPAALAALAVAAVPPARAGDVVFHERATGEAGPALAALPTLLERGTRLSLVRDPPPTSRGVTIVRLVPPTAVRAGAPAELIAHLESDEPGRARVRLVRDGEGIVDRQVEVPQGRSLLSLPVRETSVGSVPYLVTVERASEEGPLRDEAGARIDVLPAPRWLAVTNAGEGEAARFAEALRTQGIEVETRDPERLPYDPEGWNGLDGAVLLDVPAVELHSTQQEALEAFVRDRGGGLMIFGGSSSFGPGGYYRTILDRLSPLSSRVEREAPEVAMMFVLDRSGSMQQRVGEVTRLTIAKQATLAAIDLLPEGSRAGIVVFDEEAQVLVPVQPAANDATIREALAPLRPGGGTLIQAGVDLGLEAMRGVESSARHMVVMSDGLSQSDSFERLQERFASENLTVSTVAVGRGADATYLRRIARWGNGTAHVSDDFRALPSILSQEAMLLSQSPVREERVQPAWAGPRASFLDRWPASPPPLGGYVETTAKPEADVHLETGDGIALLATWRYGIGTVVAFASHAAGPWSEAWAEREAFPSWWAQLGRWASRSTRTSPRTLRAWHDGHRLHVEATEATPEDVVDSEEREEPSFRRLLARVERIDAEGAAERTLAVPLNEVAPRRFRADLAVPPGDYEVALPAREGSGSGRTAGVRIVATENGRVSPRGDTATWSEWVSLAVRTGGTVLEASESLPSRTPPAAWRWRPVSQPWGAAALLAFLLALTARYMPGRRPRSAGAPRWRRAASVR